MAKLSPRLFAYSRCLGPRPFSSGSSRTRGASSAISYTRTIAPLCVDNARATAGLLCPDSVSSHASVSRSSIASMSLGSRLRALSTGLRISV